jgi:hypothetical protein
MALQSQDMYVLKLVQYESRLYEFQLELLVV